MSKSVKKGPGESEPGEPIGKGGHAKGVVKSNKNNTFAISKMIGVVDLQQAMNTFIEQLPPVFSKQMMKLRDDRFELNKWPAILTTEKGISLNPLEMFGPALGRAIAHEARHEYIGPHSESGLGQDAPPIIGSKKTENFSEEDQKDFINKIHGLEKEQGTATVVPTYPKSTRSQKDLFPF